MMAAAAAYAQRFNWSVFPLSPLSKAPAVRRGHLEATTNPQTIQSWWTILPKAGIGISCQASGLLVIDIDPRNGGDITIDCMESMIGALPETVVQLTAGGGEHRLFRDPGLERCVGTLGPGIDIKHRGYIVAAPTALPAGRYCWEHSSRPGEVPIAELPDAWLRLLAPHQRVKRVDNGLRFQSFGYLYAAFREAGWIHRDIDHERTAVTCPWSHEHTSGKDGDTSSILYAPSSKRLWGWYHCSHSHCEGRTLRDVMWALPEAAARAGAVSVIESC